jgi:hypothetical protein
VPKHFMTKDFLGIYFDFAKAYHPSLLMDRTALS